jgi:hypothetical protein
VEGFIDQDEGEADSSPDTLSNSDFDKKVLEGDAQLDNGFKEVSEVQFDLMRDSNYSDTITLNFLKNSVDNNQIRSGDGTYGEYKSAYEEGLYRGYSILDIVEFGEKEVHGFLVGANEHLDLGIFKKESEFRYELFYMSSTDLTYFKQFVAGFEEDGEIILIFDSQELN